MSKFNNIFVVIDPTQQKQAALSRATTLAKDSSDHVHAFLCDYASEEEMAAAKSKHDAKKATLIKASEKLTNIVNNLGEHAFTISKKAYWNDSWAKSALFAANRQETDLIIKAMSPVRDKSFRFKSADRYLLRNAASPVLLTLPESNKEYKRIFAAVDLESSDEAHMRLNHSVIKNARTLAHYTGAEIHLLAAFKNSINPDLLDSCDEALSPEHHIAETYELDPELVTLKKGAPIDVILSAVEGDGDVLVMGTCARAGISGALIGNTAERVLKEIPCDILTVA